MMPDTKSGATMLRQLTQARVSCSLVVVGLAWFAIAIPASVPASGVERFVVQSTRVTLVKTIPPPAYGAAVSVVATVTDAAGTPLSPIGNTVILYVGASPMGMQATTMTAVPARPGWWVGSTRAYPASGRMYVWVTYVGSAIYDYANSPTWSFLPKARLLFTPKVAKRMLAVTGTLAPAHTRATTVKVIAQRMVRGKVVATKSLTIMLAAGETAFTGKLALTPGTWAVKTTHADATHAASASATRWVVVR